MKKRIDSKGRELFYGEYERKDGRYEYRYRRLDGTRACIYAHRLSQLRHEEAKIHLLEHINISGQISEISLNNQFDIWIASKQNIRKNTKSSYEYIYDAYVRNSLGNQLIDQINTYDIKCHYMSMKVNRRLSTETLAHVQNVLYQVFQSAVERKIIFSNPAEGACREFTRTHSKHTSLRKGLSQTQAEAFLSFVEKSDAYYRWFPLFYMFIYTGLRLSEMAGLRWCDIDFNQRLITVDHALIWVKEKNEKEIPQIGKPKTESGYRKIPLSPKMEQVLKLEKKNQQERKIRCDVVVDGYTDFIFLNKDGGVITQASVNRALKRVIFEYNKDVYTSTNGLILPHITSHSLRHTFANILCENNVNIKVIQMLMGQADIETTMNIYTQVSGQVAYEEYQKKVWGEEPMHGVSSQ